jgi:NitT/TauT family transport system substrate-binding protein
MGFAVDKRFVIALAAFWTFAGAVMAIKPAQADEIVVTSWGANLNSVPYAVGMEKGFFKEAGIDITSILTTSGGGTAVRNVMASATPYGEVSLDAAISAIKSGLPLVIVNAACRTVSEAAWVARKDSKIDGIKGLAGKRVAYTRPKSVSEMLLILSLGGASVDLNSVKRIAAGGYREGMTLLDNDAVDVAPVIEPTRSAVEANYKEVFRAVDYLKPMITTVGVTTREFAEKNPTKLAAIISGYRKSVQYTYEHPDEAAELMAKHSSMKADLLKLSISHVVPSKFWSDGSIEPVELNNMVQGLRSVGMMDDTGIDWSKLVDQSFLPAELRRKL